MSVRRHKRLSQVRQVRGWFGEHWEALIKTLMGLDVLFIIIYDLTVKSSQPTLSDDGGIIYPWPMELGFFIYFLGFTLYSVSGTWLAWTLTPAEYSKYLRKFKYLAWARRSFPMGRLHTDESVQWSGKFVGQICAIVGFLGVALFAYRLGTLLAR